MFNNNRRVILIVMDSVGIGALPDAHEYGDEGSNTLRTIAEKSHNFSVPNLQSLGLGNIANLPNVSPVPSPSGCFGKMAEQSPGKDTTTGHWEIAGIVLENPFPVYPNGFPLDVVRRLEKSFRTRILGNKVASGTAIIDELGEQHMNSGEPIVYTSADSVLQIAAHTDVVSLDKLYTYCQIARRVMKDEHGVGRIIARPFVGSPGKFQRTKDRRDFSLVPREPNLLVNIHTQNLNVYAIGKIEDIFAGQGISESCHSHDNKSSMTATLDALNVIDEGLIFTNLVDFDMLYGHRNDIQGYADALMEFDQWIPELLKRLNKGDLLVLTADHGCDPGNESTDHTREYVPLLIHGPNFKSGVNLEIRQTFADVGQTICDYLQVEPLKAGQSFLNLIIQNEVN